MDERAVIGCIDWVTHGFEVVQSIFPNWTFLAADRVAAYGLHGALGRAAPFGCVSLRRVAQRTRELRDRPLSKWSLADHGRAANVFDGPLYALRHLVELLAADPFNPPLAAGEIVTTGTLTRAFRSLKERKWTTRLTGIPLEGAHIRFI